MVSEPEGEGRILGRYFWTGESRKKNPESYNASKNPSPSRDKPLATVKKRFLLVSDGERRLVSWSSPTLGS